MAWDETVSKKVTPRTFTMNLPSHTRLWVVGATGLVGRAILDILLKEWHVPQICIECVASPKKTHQPFEHHEHRFTLRSAEEGMFSDQEKHFVLLATDTQVSKEWVQFIKTESKTSTHITTIDSSSAYRLDPKVPLVIPEINGYLLQNKPALITSPNCTTLGFLYGILPFWKHLKVKRILMSTYQAASGVGYAALQALNQDLATQTRTSQEYFPFPLAHNCIPQIGTFDSQGFSQEEVKVRAESQKILGTQIPIHVTCARIPVELGHSESVTLECAHPLTLQDIHTIINHNSDSHRIFASPPHQSRSLHDVLQSDNVAVSRVRIQPDDPTFLHLWLQFDNIRMGAATNICRILSAMLK